MKFIGLVYILYIYICVVPLFSHEFGICGSSLFSFSLLLHFDQLQICAESQLQNIAAVTAHLKEHRFIGDFDDNLDVDN